MRILIDCMPSLGMITINALVAADYVLVPVEAAYLPVKGLQQLIKTIGNIHRKLNSSLEILGILLTKVDRRTNFARDTSDRIREVYGNRVHIFENCIPLSVRAAETAAEGKSIYLHDPKGIVAEGYTVRRQVFPQKTIWKRQTPYLEKGKMRLQNPRL